MLPGNMIIVIICTLLRSYPPDSSPLHNSPVILPAWLLFLSLSFSPLFPSFLSSSSLFLSRSIPAVMPSCVMLSLRSSSPVLPFSSCESLSFSRRLSHHPATPFSHTPVLPFSLCRFLSAFGAAGRRIERKRTRTGPTEATARQPKPLSSLAPFSSFDVHPPSASFFLQSFLVFPFPAVTRKTLQREMLSLRRTFRLALSLSVSLPVSLYLSCSLLVVTRGSIFFTSFSLLLSLVAPLLQQLSARGSFQLVPVETFHRPPFSVFFLRAFSRLLELFSRI